MNDYELNCLKAAVIFVYNEFFRLDITEVLPLFWSNKYEKR